MAAEKDRRTRMINSSVNSQPKKMGAGGSYTWGNPMDVNTYYEPSGITSSVGVVLAPAPVSLTPLVATQSIPFIQDTQAFPTLGAAPAMVVNQAWGPKPSQPLVLQQTVRSGSIDMFGAQHPRNLFAKKPTVMPVPTTGPAVQQGMIDWSSTGMPQEMMQSILAASTTGAAHLGPYGQAAPSTVPLDVLRSRNVASQSGYNNFAPRLDNQYVPNVNQSQRANRVIQQPQKR